MGFGVMRDPQVGGLHPVSPSFKGRDGIAVPILEDGSGEMERWFSW